MRRHLIDHNLNIKLLKLGLPVLSWNDIILNTTIVLKLKQTLHIEKTPENIQYILKQYNLCNVVN